MKSPVWIIALSLVFVGAVVGALYFFDMHEQVIRLLRWMEASEPWTALLFIGLMIVAVVLLLPGVFFTTGAGFIFGIAEGTLYVVIGTTIGATISFLLARYCLPEATRGLVFKHSGFRHITQEMARHDFRVVLLTRLIPFFPGKVSNYFFGLTPFGLRNFILASAIGFIPFSFHNAYLGSLAADLVTVGQGSVTRSPLQWLFWCLGLFVTMYFIWFLYRLANKNLAQLSADEDSKVEAS